METGGRTRQKKFRVFSREGGGIMAKRKCVMLIEELKESENYNMIRSDLFDQLDRDGTVGRYYADLVEDYMDLWLTKSLLLTDIKSRGVTVTYNNGGGQRGVKKNESVEQVLKVNTQMLKILDSIGIKPSINGGDADEEL